MPRMARLVMPGLPHHVTQRGNRRGQVFFSSEDRQRYMGLFQHYRLRYDLEVLAYCLMDNHVHWVVVPKQECALADTLRDAHASYAVDVNQATRTCGHFFQGRFFSCPLDGEHLWAAVRYFERNPVRTRVVARAEDYAWSSAQAHCGLRDDPLLTPGFPPPGVVSDWPTWLAAEDAQQMEAVRRHTLTGRPWGSAAFVAQLEALTGRILQPLKRGRKKRLVVPGQKELFQ